MRVKQTGDGKSKSEDENTIAANSGTVQVAKTPSDYDDAIKIGRRFADRNRRVMTNLAKGSELDFPRCDS
jgi:hypothetical protein